MHMLAANQLCDMGRAVSVHIAICKCVPVTAMCVMALNVSPIGATSALQAE